MRDEHIPLDQTNNSKHMINSCLICHESQYHNQILVHIHYYAQLHVYVILWVSVCVCCLSKTQMIIKNNHVMIISINHLIFSIWVVCILQWSYHVESSPKQLCHLFQYIFICILWFRNCVNWLYTAISSELAFYPQKRNCTVFLTVLSHR